MTKLRIASLLVALAAAVLLGRLAVFLVDAEQTQLSLSPGDEWLTRHSCLTAYGEAGRYAAEPGRNIYDPSLYDKRFIGNLKVDTYHYPPPFLLLPGGLQRIAGGFDGLRPVWFVLQLGLLVAAMWLLTRWLGGETGARLRLASPLFFIAPATLSTLQIGNFQSSALALALIGMIALTSRRAPVQALGGIAFAYAAISKVFPGILAVYLIVTRRWRALAWATFAGVSLVALTLAIYGSGPFSDFIHYQLPRLSSGEAFPQSETPRAAAANMSVYGLLVKLRTLGVPGLDIKTGLAISSVYGLLVLALAVGVAWMRRARVDQPEERTANLVVWLALVNLASFRSPFVGGVYGTVGTLWLALILVCAADHWRPRLAWLAVFAMTFLSAFAIRAHMEPPTQTRVAVSLVLHAAIIVVNAWVCVGGALRARRPILTGP